jgi:hypothetical protein
LYTAAIVALLAGCQSLDAETAQATVCATDGCVQPLECATGLLFRRGENHLRYFEGERSTLSDCRRALSEAGFAKIEFSACEATENSENCLEIAVTPVEGSSSFKPETFGQIPAQRLFVHCAEQHRRVKEVRREGDRYRVTVETHMDEDVRLEKVRALCQVHFSRAANTEAVRHVCRYSGTWKVCNESGS